MHAADSRAHLSERYQEQLHLLRISHDRRKRYRAHFLRAALSKRVSPAPALQRRAPGLRGPLQKVAAALFQALAYFSESVHNSPAQPAPLDAPRGALSNHRQGTPAMRPIVSFSVLILAASISTYAQSKPPVPPSDYGQWESLVTFREYGGLSPDGKWF